MLEWHRQKRSGILTCSALKAEYRAHLASGLPEVRFVWLDPPRSVLQERMTHRPGHFMPAVLLDSQLATLEPPTEATDEARVLRLHGTEPIEQEIRIVLNWLAHPNA